MFARFKIYFYAAALIAIGLFCWWLYAKGHSAGEDSVRAEFREAAEKQRDEALAKEKADRDELNRRSADYERQISDLRNNQPPIPVVRVSNCPRSSRPVPSPPTAPSEPSQAPADGLDREDGRDIGPDFRAYAIDCKAVAIQLREVIQAWPKP